MNVPFLPMRSTVFLGKKCIVCKFSSASEVGILLSFVQKMLSSIWTDESKHIRFERFILPQHKAIQEEILSNAKKDSPIVCKPPMGCHYDVHALPCPK
jgi:hypothetical protein